MTMTRQRLDPADRKELILSAAYELAFDGALLTMTTSDILECTGVQTAPSTLRHYFGSVAGVQIAVVALAIEREDLLIIGMALVGKIGDVHNAPTELKERALAHLVALADDD